MKIRGGSSIVVGQVLTAVGQLLGLRLLTGVLVPAEFGRFSLVLITVTLVSQVVFAPLHQAILRRYWELPEDSRQAVIRKHLLQPVQLLFAAVVLLALPFLHLLPEGYRVSYLAFGAAAVFVLLENRKTVELNLFNSAFRHTVYSAWLSVSSFLRPGMAVLFVLVFKPSADIAFLGYAVASALELLIFLPFVEARSTTYQGDRGELRKLQMATLRFMLPLALLPVTGWIVNSADRFFLLRMVDPAAVGIYSAAYSLTSRAFTTLFTGMNLFWRPKYYKEYADDAGHRASGTLWKWFIAVLVLSALGTLLFYLLSGFLADLLLGAQYHRSAQFFVWIALGHIFLILGYTLNTALYAAHRTLRIFLNNAFGALVCVAALYYLIKAFGDIGAAYACPVYFGAEFVLIALAVLVHKGRRGTAGQAPATPAVQA